MSRYFIKIISDYLVEDVIRYVKVERVMPSELLDAFILRSMEAIQKADSRYISDKYIDLRLLATDQSEKIQSGKVKSNVYAFQFGQINSCISMIDEMINKEKESAALVQKNAFFKKHIRIFEKIDEEPGINHSELAKQVGKSPSSLSQIISKIRFFDYITGTSYGREKFYYLTEKGKTMLETLHNEQPNHEVAVNPPTVLNPIIVHDDYFDISVVYDYLNKMSLKFYKKESMPVMPKDIIQTSNAVEYFTLRDFSGKRIVVSINRNKIKDFMKKKSLWDIDAKLSDFPDVIDDIGKETKQEIICKVEALYSNLQEQHNSYNEIKIRRWDNDRILART